MAIVGTIAAGTESKWGIIQASTAAALGEAAFGTQNDDADSAEMYEGPIPSVDYGVIRINNPLNDGGRVRKDTGVYYTQTGGIRQINFSDLTLRRKDLAPLLYAVCQNMDEGEADQYTKIITIDETTTQPNFAADAGFFASIGIYDTTAAYHRIFPSCILSSLTLSADLTGDGLLKASGTWMSGFIADTTATLSGTWAYNTQNYYDFHAPTTKQVGSADIVLFGFSVTITNGANRVGGTTAGNAETYALPEYNVTGSLTVKYDTAVQGIIADSLAGTGRKIELATGTAGGVGHFGFVLDECFFDDIAKDYGDQRGQSLTLPFTADFSTGANLAVFTLSDGVDRAWPT